LAAVVPVGHVTYGFEDAARAHRVEPRAWLPGRAVEAVAPVLERILVVHNGDLVDEPLHHERDAVGARRTQRARRDVERRVRRGVHREVRDEAPRELTGRNDGRGAGHEVAERDEFARGVEPGLEIVETAGP